MSARLKGHYGSLLRGVLSYFPHRVQGAVPWEDAVHSDFRGGLSASLRRLRRLRPRVPRYSHDNEARSAAAAVRRVGEEGRDGAGGRL